jgi:hypothetical protein
MRPQQSRANRLLLPLALAVLAGCEHAATPLMGPEDARYSEQRVVRSVTGTGHIDHPVGDEDFFRTFAFVALERADGSVIGTFELTAREVPVRVHGQITCIGIADNAAWLGGEIEQSSDPDRVAPGTKVRWRLVDNGEGVATPPDQISLVLLGGDPASYCANMPPTSPIQLFDLVAGNLRVRG